MASPKFKVVVQRPEGTKSLFGSNAYEMERDALDPIGARGGSGDPRLDAHNDMQYCRDLRRPPRLVRNPR